MKTMDLVKSMLIADVQCRKDDYYLWLKILKHKNIDLSMSAETFLKDKFKYIVNFETVSRCRRKVQEENPTLRDSETHRHRTKEIDKYVDIARGMQWQKKECLLNQ